MNRTITKHFGPRAGRGTALDASQSLPIPRHDITRRWFSGAHIDGLRLWRSAGSSSSRKSHDSATALQAAR